MYRNVAKRLTGRATDIDVASSAAIKVMTAKLAKARLNRHPGLKSSIELFDFSDAESGLEGESVSTGFDSAMSRSSSDDLEGVAIATLNDSSNGISDVDQREEEAVS